MFKHMQDVKMFKYMQDVKMFKYMHLHKLCSRWIHFGSLINSIVIIVNNTVHFKVAERGS